MWLCSERFQKSKWEESNIDFVRFNLFGRHPTGCSLLDVQRKLWKIVTDAQRTTFSAARRKIRKIEAKKEKNGHQNIFLKNWRTETGGWVGVGEHSRNKIVLKNTHWEKIWRENFLVNDSYRAVMCTNLKRIANSRRKFGSDLWQMAFKSIGHFDYVHYAISDDVSWDAFSFHDLSTGITSVRSFGIQIYNGHERERLSWWNTECAILTTSTPLHPKLHMRTFATLPIPRLQTYTNWRNRAMLIILHHLTDIHIT